MGDKFARKARANNLDHHTLSLFVETVEYTKMDTTTPVRRCTKLKHFVASENSAGATEIAEVEYAIQAKLQRLENTGVENTGQVARVKNAYTCIFEVLRWAAL